MSAGADSIPNDPGDSRLRQQIITYERHASPREFRRMRQEGELDEYVAIKIRATRSHAQFLISQGELPSEAWRKAIRQYILEQELD